MMTETNLRILKGITILFMLLSVGVLTYVAWEVRQPIIEKITGPKVRADGARIPNPGPQTIAEIKSFIDSQPFIEGVNIVKVDFKENTRKATFIYFKTQAVTTSWNQYTQSGAVTPLFGPNESNNQRIVSLINGETNCVPALLTSAGQVIPHLVDYVTDVCSVAIPPGYGDFVGFINIFMKRHLAPQEKLMIQKRGETVALAMYERDVIKSSRLASELGAGLDGRMHR
jgi:hypothetical protein